MALYNTWEFKIGVLDGEYPAGTTITDSVFKLFWDNVAAIGSFGQIYNTAFSIVSGTCYLPFTSIDDDIVTIYFKQPVNIG